MFCGVSQYLKKEKKTFDLKPFSGFNHPACPSLVTLLTTTTFQGRGKKSFCGRFSAFSYPDSPFKIPIRPLPPETGRQGVGTFKFSDVWKILFFVGRANETREDIQTGWLSLATEYFNAKFNSRFYKTF